jgi:hypothetical protein
VRPQGMKFPKVAMIKSFLECVVVIENDDPSGIVLPKEVWISTHFGKCSVAVTDPSIKEQNARKCAVQILADKGQSQAFCRPNQTGPEGYAMAKFDFEFGISVDQRAGDSDLRYFRNWQAHFLRKDAADRLDP